MTRLLEDAITEVQSLSENDQDAIASLILEELADEERWRDSFSSSQEVLAKMAEKARQDRVAGKVREMGFDEIRIRILRRSSSIASENYPRV